MAQVIAQPRRGIRLEYAVVLGCVLLWGMQHTAGKIALREITGAQLAFLRPALAFLTLLLLLVALRRTSSLASTFRARPGTLVLLGLFGFTGAGGLTMLTLTYLPAGITSLLSNTTPLMLVLGVAVATRTFSALPIAGAVVGFVGVAVLSLGNVAPSAVQSTNAALIGVPLGLLSSAFWAAYTIYARRLAGSDPLVTTTLTSGLGTLFIGLVAVPTQDWSNVPTLAPLTMVCIAFVGCVSMALTYVGWSFALSRLPATTVAPFSYLIPVLGLLVAHLVLGEDLTIAVVLGAALVLGGIALSQTTTWRALLWGRVKQ